nr:hypothetical protein [Polymorphobacter sp.]
MIAVRKWVPAIALLLAACGGAAEHRFTDVVETKPSPDGKVVAASVWEERGPGKPHASAIVVVARGGDARDAAPVLLTSDDFHPIAYSWTGPAALTLRLPCGRWSNLANHAVVGGRTVTIASTPAQGCYVGPAGTGALPGPGL